MLTPGSSLPDVVLTNQHGELVDLAQLRGKRVLIFFYPKANTPGCTQQACGLRDVAGSVDGTVIVGISPDKPAAQKKFDDKYELGYDLLADTEHTVAEAFGVWQEKVNYGKRYMGIVRSAFLIDPRGVVEQAWYKISPSDTPKKLLEAVGK
jgi:peroxiredoxin Q/BCP